MPQQTTAKPKGRTAYRRGLLPLSADPMSYGHLDLIQRASVRCDELVVAVSVDPSKTPLFDPETRCKQVERTVREAHPELTNIRVIVSPDLLTDIYMVEGCDVVIRGIRDEHDAEYESLQTRYHEMALPSIKGHFELLGADPSLAHIQSSVIREFARRFMDVTNMTPMFIQARLWRVLHQVKTIGVFYPFTTTDAGVKTQVQVEMALAEAFNAAKIPFHTLDTTTYGSRLLRDEPGAGVQALRDKIKADPLNCSEELFAHEDRIFRHEMKGKTGVVLVTLAGPDFIRRVNNNVIVVNIPEEDGQLNPMLKRAREEQAKHHYGSIIEFNATPDANYKALADLIVAKVRGSEI